MYTCAYVYMYVCIYIYINIDILDVCMYIIYIYNIGIYIYKCILSSPHDLAKKKNNIQADHQAWCTKLPSRFLQLLDAFHGQHTGQTTMQGARPPRSKAHGTG